MYIHRYINRFKQYTEHYKAAAAPEEQDDEDKTTTTEVV